jgi:hypothetical protein
VLQTLLNIFACMLENAVLNVFRVVARLLAVTQRAMVVCTGFGFLDAGPSASRTPSVLCCGTPGTPLIFKPTASAMTRTEAPLPDTLQGRAGLDVSVIAIAPPPLPRGIAKLLAGGPSEALKSQVRPVLRCQADEGRRRKVAGSVDSSARDVPG